MNLNELAIAKSITDEPVEAAKLMDSVEANVRVISTTWEAYSATKLTVEEKRLADQFAEARQKFVAEALLPAVAAVRAQNTQLATELLHSKMETLFEPVRQHVNALIKLQEDVAKEEFETRQRAYVPET